MCDSCKSQSIWFTNWYNDIKNERKTDTQTILTMGAHAYVSCNFKIWLTFVVVNCTELTCDRFFFLSFKSLVTYMFYVYVCYRNHSKTNNLHNMIDWFAVTTVVLLSCNLYDFFFFFAIDLHLCRNFRDTTLKNRTSNECIGLQKRYRICNEQVSTTISSVFFIFIFDIINEDEIKTSEINVTINN